MIIAFVLTFEMLLFIAIHCVKPPRLYESIITTDSINSIIQDYSPKVVEIDPQDIIYPRDESLFNDSMIPQVSQFTGYSDIDGFEEFQSESSSVLDRDEDISSSSSEGEESLLDLLEISTDNGMEVLSSESGDLLEGIEADPPFIPSKNKYSIPMIKYVQPSISSLLQYDRAQEKPPEQFSKNEAFPMKVAKESEKSEKSEKSQKQENGWYESPVDLNDIFHSVSTTPRSESPNYEIGEVQLSTLFGDDPTEQSMESCIDSFQLSIATKMNRLTDEWIDGTFADLPDTTYNKVGEVVFNRVVPTIENVLNLLCSLLPNHPLHSLIPEIEGLLGYMSDVKESAKKVAIRLLKEKLSFLIQEKRAKEVLNYVQI